MSKVVFKISYKNPNFKESRGQNSAHINYIANRPGVDKTITEKELEKELERGVSENSDYTKYINERPGSHGLFGPTGIEDIKKIQEEIADSKGYVWRAIVSIKEDDSIKLGYDNKEKWQDMLRKKIPDMANEMGIKTTNLKWVSAIHMEKGHPHAHIVFWEKEPTRMLGTINQKDLNNIRKMYVDEIFEDERFQLLNEKNLMRDYLRDLAKNDITDVTKIIKEIKETNAEIKTIAEELNNPGLNPKLYKREEIILAEKLENLSKIMPGKGRIALKFMPEEVKKEVVEIADYILKQPDFSASLERNLIATEELTKLYTGKEYAINQARENSYNDIRNRISQIILKGAVESKRTNMFHVDPELSSKTVDFIKNIEMYRKNEFYSTDSEHQKSLMNLSKILFLSKVEKEDVINIIEKINQNNYLKLDDEKLLNIVNRSHRDVEENNQWNKVTIISKEEWQNTFENLGLKESPEWFYKGLNFNPTYSIVNNIWKNAWGQLESQRLQTEIQAEYMKKNLTKQQALDNVGARKEQARKSKDRGSMSMDDDLEL